MKLEELFNEDGQYTCDSFVDGFFIEIKDGMFLGNQYKGKYYMFPERWLFHLSKNLFTHDYKKVFTRQSLFKT